ncbi:MAG: IS110 family transposase [Candidatus Dormibacteria bacterium]
MSVRTIGLDVHKHVTQVSVLEGGREVSNEQIETTPAALRKLVATLRSDDQVVLEATVNTWPIADLLRPHVARVVISNPLKTRAIASAKLKSDRVDSRVLAELLAADYIPEVWVPDEGTRQLRHLVSRRRSLVQQQTRQRNRIHAVLQRNLVDCPATDLFGVSGRRWLAEVELPTNERLEVDSDLRVLAVMEEEVRSVDNDVAVAVVHDQRVRRLLTIPGVGITTAAAVVAVVGDVKRFERPNKLVGYFGLDPRVRQSGDQPFRTGHISRQGQAHARGLLIEAAHATVRVPGPFRAFYERVSSRRGKQSALVAVARKLTVLSWHLLTKEQDYQWALGDLTARKYKLLEVKAGIASPARVMGQGVFARDTMVQARKVLANAESAYKMMVAARAIQEGRGRLNEGTTRWPKAGSATEISPSNSALRHEVDRA